MILQTLLDRIRTIKSMDELHALRREIGPSRAEVAANEERERAMDDLLPVCEWDVDYPPAAAHNARKQYTLLQTQCEQEFYRFYPRVVP